MDISAQIEALRPQQASTLTTQQVMEELHNRNEESFGFPDEDKEKLQEIFDREFEEKKEQLIADLQRREKEKRLNEQRRAEELRQKRIALEEKNALQADEELQMWSSILSEGKPIPPYLRRFQLRGPSLRVLCKSMYKNPWVQNVDFSNMELDNEDAQTVANLISENECIVKVDLAGNNIGPEGCISLARAMSEPANGLQLQCLNLDRNPLAGVLSAVEDDSQYDSVGTIALAKAVSGAASLRVLSLFACTLGKGAGEAFVDAAAANKSIVVLELGQTDVDSVTLIRASKILKRNNESHKVGLVEEKVREDVRRAETAAAYAEQKKKEAEVERERWIEAKLDAWKEERRRIEEEERKKREEEKKQQEEEARRKAEEEAAAEAAKKKKKKKKKKK